eukprot:scaffold47_cov112-Isochrysis_galbana.AAC.17
MHRHLDLFSSASPQSASPDLFDTHSSLEDLKPPGQTFWHQRVQTGRACWSGSGAWRGHGMRLLCDSSASARGAKAKHACGSM